MQATETDLDLATSDLGPLAWVLDELRKSLEAASGALRRFVRDAGLARGQDMASVDAGQLRIARQQLHQAVGALEMVGLGSPALVLRAMEAAVQKFVERPELCSEAAASKVERAGFALTEYLERVLLGKASSPVALFPQYRDVQELVASDRIHPADLWPLDWRWTDPDTPAVSHKLGYEPALRARMDHHVLKIVKSADAKCARELAEWCQGLAAAQEARQPRIFWKLAAAYFQAIAFGLLPPDVYVKRAASRILLQYASLAKGELGVSDRLAQDLLFFCAQAVPTNTLQAPILAAVRAAWGLARYKPVDYQTPQYGRFDPVLLTQARKRIAATKDTWSAVSGGDANKLKQAGEQFHHIADSLMKLHAASAPLARSLVAAVDTVVKSGQSPKPEVAMEVATAVLYLEAAFQDLDPTDAQLAMRMGRLADRLDRVRQGGQAQALEPWMEELYRRVSDRQTMGSVVGELRSTMGELEKVLDAFFRNPKDKGVLKDAPTHLMQMRGVLSVLGLDQATHAVARMRESVENILVTEVDEEQARAAGTFEKLGNNLGALGFLIDMLNYQPALAKKLFVFDEEEGELRPLMGRVGDDPAEAELEDDPADAPAALQPDEEPTVSLRAEAASALVAAAMAAAPAAPSRPAPLSSRPAPLSSRPAPLVPFVPSAPAPLRPLAVVQEEDADPELREIFLEEAREVVGNGLAAIDALAADPANVGELTTLRRAFHTLKGSSRMVGLNEFGEAGWALEQVLNTWLADQKPASEGLCMLSAQALRGFGRWIEDIAAHGSGGWKASMFRGPADAWRTEGRLLPFAFPGGEGQEAVPQPAFGAAAASADVDAPADLETATAFDTLPPEFLSLDASPDSPPEQATASSSAESPFGIDFAALSTAAPVPEAAAADLEDEPGTAPVPLEEPELAAPAEPALDTAPDLPAFGATHVIRGEPPTAQEIPFDELPPDLLEFGFAPAPAATIETLPQVEAIDFGSLAPLAQPEAAPEAQAPSAAEEAAPVEDSVAALPTEQPASPQLLPDLEITGDASDDQVKVIGGLRIGIPLYNVYLNEADEWSRRLSQELGEWALQLDQPIPDAAVGLAHALGGSSATVGFHALSEVARSLENALQHAQTLAWGTPQHGKAFVDAAEEIRRLLHQFAAGFLKEADPRIARSLAALDDLQLPQRAEFRDSSVGLLEPAGDGVHEATPTAFPQPAPVVQPATQFVEFDPAPAVAGEASHVQERAEGEDDDIDVADAIDPDLFPIFEEEAQELLPALGTSLRQWAHHGQRGARDEVLRALHTLKGSARLAGALRLGEMAHRMESEIEALPAEAGALDLEPLLQRFDSMQTRFEALRAGTGAPLSDAGVTLLPSDAELAASAGNEPGPSQAAAPQGPVLPSRAILAVPPSQLLAARAIGGAVRVRAQLLDRLMNQTGEVIITRSRLENELGQLKSSLHDLTGNLDRLRTQLRDIELQAETQMQSRLAQAKDSAVGFDPLEFDRFTRVQELTRMMAESVNDVATVQRNLQRTVEATEDDLIAQARQTRELQRDLLRTRMVEFEGISDRLYRVVRLASKETGKLVKLDITGGSIEMDRGVLDRMTPAFEHLLRNCVAHGIEDAATRTAAGKDASGTILIDVRQEGNDVSVEFRDDGAGLDLARIREKAVQQGLVAPDQALSDADAANLIFMPGFSTAAAVTELAGRGIGMDVVRADVNALGGRIETSTQAGRGTSFRLVLPLTTAVTQVVMLRSGNLSIGVPANLVEIVRRANGKEVQQAYNSGTYEFGGEQVPFFWSGALLQSSARSTEPQGKTLPIVVFRSAAQRVAVHVDEVLGNQEVVVKNLGPQLARLPGLAGMTVLASGAVVLIYNPVALSAVYGDQARQLSADKAQPDQLEGGAAVPSDMSAAAPQIPLVLVVDDSITVRRVTQRLLQREGYRVALAADGLQALERLAEERPAVVLSDIEMPRMDGFDLARNIRADARWASLPIVMITSRIAEKHREHAKELGVNHYLGKPYSEEELLSLVKHYSFAAAVTA